MAGAEDRINELLENQRRWMREQIEATQARSEDLTQLLADLEALVVGPFGMGRVDDVSDLLGKMMGILKDMRKETSLVTYRVDTAEFAMWAAFRALLPGLIKYGKFDSAIGDKLLQIYEAHSHCLLEMSRLPTSSVQDLNQKCQKLQEDFMKECLRILGESSPEPGQ